MTLSSVLSRKDDKLIGLKSFGIVRDGLPALGMKMICDLNHCCGILPSAGDLLKIFMSLFVAMSPACWISSGVISSGPADL